MTDTALHDDDCVSAVLTLSDLPSKVAQVQAELHHLDQAVQQTRQVVRQTELAAQESHDSQQILQQQLQQDLAIGHVLQLQQADLLTLKSAKGQRSVQSGKQAVLQKSQLTARQQLKRMTASFEGMCNKFQARFQSEQMEASSAATAESILKLESQTQVTQQTNCQQEQLSQDAAQLLQEGQQRVHTLRLAIADKQHQCDEEDRRYRQLKAAQAETEMSSKVQAIRVSDSVVHSQINIAKDRIAECQCDIACLDAGHVKKKKDNSIMELQIARLQAALNAMSAPSDALAQQAAAASSGPTLHQSETGVFSSQNAPDVAALKHSRANRAAPTSTHNMTPCTQPQHTRQQAAPLKRQSQQVHFQYPEDAPSPVGQLQGQSNTASTSSWHTQRRFISKSSGNGAGQKTAAYTVEEPDSPAQPASTLQHDACSWHPSRASDRGTDECEDPPAGCLYQDTTIRRTTTPLRNGRPAGEWSHHEEITVRQVRQIKQSEAGLHPMPPVHQPHVVQTSEVRHRHRNGKESVIISRQQPSDLNGDHAAPRQWFANTRDAADRAGYHMQELTNDIGHGTNTFAAYNTGGNKRQGGVGPVRGPGRLPAARGRGCRPAGHPPSLSAAVKKRRMKCLFPDDEDMAIYPSDEEEKLRRKQRQEEDEADAELIVQFQAAPHQQ